MADCNPCCCWNLKDGCITIGIWSLVFAFCQLSVFTWQTFVIVQCQNNGIPYMSPLDCPIHCPCFAYSPERPPLGGPIWRGNPSSRIILVKGCLEIFFQLTNVWSIIQMGIFSWQTAVMKWLRDKIENRRVPGYNSYTLYDNRLGGGDWNENYITPEEKIYMALFIVQILNLIAAFFLLFASVALIYGIHTSSKYLIWPWFPCIVASIVCAITYCVLWWVGNVVSYWLALTVIEFLGVIINVYCLICVFLQYRRILKGYVQHTSEEDYNKPKQIIYEYRTADERQQEISEYHRRDDYQRDDEFYQQKPGIEGYLNATFEHEPYSATKVSVYKGADQDVLMRRTIETVQDTNIQETQELQIVTTGATVGDQETEYKDMFTEEWLKNVMEKGPTAIDKVPIPEIFERPVSRRSKSEAREEKYKKHEHKSRGKSKDSVRSKRSHRSASKHEGSSVSDEEGKSKSEKSRRSQSEGERRHKHHRHHRRDDDTETKASRSAVGESERTSRKDKDEHKRHKRKEDDLKRHKRPRDVKREDKERAAGKAMVESGAATIAQRPDSSSTDRTIPSDGKQLITPSGVSSMFPSYAVPPGGISIPQHIVIPPQPTRPVGQPQKYQINSEITISYSDKSNPTSDTEARRSQNVPQVRQLPTPLIPTVKPPSPQSMISTAAVATQTANQARNGSTGGDSKSHGSTAV